MRTLISGVTPKLKVVYKESDIKQGLVRAPAVGDVTKYDDGDEFIFCSTNADIPEGRAAIRHASDEFTLPITTPAGMTSLTLYSPPRAFSEGELVGSQFCYRAGSGFFCRIVGNTATDGSLPLTIHLSDPTPGNMVRALTKANIVYLPGMLVSLGDVDGIFVGVPQVDVNAATLGKTLCFWAQSKGVALVKCSDVNVGMGSAIYLGESGYFVGADDYTTKDVGYCISAPHVESTIVNLW
jgi:hypothetical protein